jgi:hypothetical protein
MISELKHVINSYKRLEKAWTSSSKNTADYHAATCLFEYQSYRLLESDKTDMLLGFRVFLRTLRRIFKAPSGIIRFNPKSEALVVSGTIAIQERVTEYIKRSGHIDLNTYVAKDVMTFSGISKLKMILALSPFALRQSLRCMVNPYRLGIALSIAEVAEIAFLIDYIKKNNIRKVFDFVPYEIDSNFMYLELASQKITVVKIPSSGPLATHHRILLADEVIFSTPYHYEEFLKFKDSFRVKQQTLWPPERAYQYYPLYKTDPPKPESKTLGFYSHGEWLRKEEKHSAYGGKIGEAEATILRYLGQYVKDNPEFKLIIFPHPREMKPEVRTRMNAFYQKTISHDNFELATYPGGTTQHFAKVDIALAAFSTILYERLYCGYKTLIGNMAITEFPMNRSPLNNICFRTYESMLHLIDKYSNKDATFFFEDTHLDSFRATHYPEP